MDGVLPHDGFIHRCKENNKIKTEHNGRLHFEFSVRAGFKNTFVCSAFKGLITENRLKVSEMH